MKGLRRKLYPLLAIAALAWAAPLLSDEAEEIEQTGGGTAVRLEVKGAIGPATSDYVIKGIDYADEIDANLIVIEMDTPGGLDSAMRDMIKAILNSDIPVVTYVSPSGSRAASAGTYLLYASHIAAMAPATNLGAATPVQIGGGEQPSSPFGTPEPKEQPKSDDAEDESPDAGEEAPAPLQGTAMERKAINDAVAYIRGLAELRGRNADWAEKAVREAASLSAEEALEQNVIDVVAASLDELLDAIDGRMVRVLDADEEIDSDEIEVETFEADWRTKLLATITDPNVAYLLMLAGIYGLLFEGYNPGAIVPGVVGAICLLLALFAFQVLPVNYAGLALILLGVMLIVAEAFVPSFGALGLGGVAAFVFGSIILLDTDVPGMQIARSLISGVALLASSLLLLLVYMLMRMRRRPAVSGMESMLGQLAEALEDFDEHGQVFVHGERWLANTTVPVRKGDQVRVDSIDGLHLEVSPVEK
ncbi:MAG: nodulation protein NfeD [Gammaproteobacteria bacterium]|nr:nodulation protein NfeD [Gammaproteobacteria bacterium]